MKALLLRINEQYFGPDHKRCLCELPEDRQRKINNYRRDQDKLLSFWAGMLTRKVLGKERISFGQHGKPYCADRKDVFFSLSHAWPYVFFAVSTSNIGVDIEKKETGKTALAKRFFTERECKIIDDSSDSDEAFFKVWTGKEAYLKMRGTGLTVPLNSVDIVEKKEQGYIMWDTLGQFVFSICSEKPCFQTNFSVFETDGVVWDPGWNRHGF